ncbi:MAG: 50S ribosomal protein L17 [Candidatus Eisenbacteria bacterium]|nr:50S ribosomal protein L17 [Candidatus Eisenbacteria bacterium]
MRHRKKGRKLNRTWSHKKAMLRNMATTLIETEQIETTDAKAKELRSLAERLVTLAKPGGNELAARRQALRVVRSKKAVAKLFSELGPRFADRPGGYTRIVKVENRRGDGAPLSILQFLGADEKVVFKERKARPEEVYEEDRRRSQEAKPEAAPEPEETVEAAADEGGVEVQDEAADASQEEAPEKAEAKPDEAEPEVAGEPEGGTSEEAPAEGGEKPEKKE